jgi:hypothetical protein
MGVEAAQVIVTGRTKLDAGRIPGSYGSYQGGNGYAFLHYRLRRSSKSSVQQDAGLDWNGQWPPLDHRSAQLGELVHDNAIADRDRATPEGQPISFPRPCDCDMEHTRHDGRQWLSVLSRDAQIHPMADYRLRIEEEFPIIIAGYLYL